jgi:hypothetical protein
MAFTDLMYKEKQKIILALIVIYGIVYEIFFFFLFFTNISLLGEIGTGGTFDTNYGLYIILNQMFLLLIVFVTGTIFARQSTKSSDPEVKLKGKLLLVAFYSFFLGAILDVLSQFSPFLLTTARMILIIAALAFYGGFILPDWLKRYFSRDYMIFTLILIVVINMIVNLTLQFPSSISYNEGIYLTIELIVILLLIISFIMFYIKATLMETKSQKMVYYGYSIFLLCFGLSRTFLLLAKITTGVNVEINTNLFYMIEIFGIISWLYILEIYMVEKTKKMLSISTIILSVLAFVTLIGAQNRILIYITLLFSIGGIISLCIYITIKTPGIVRKRTLWLLIGLILLFAGYVMDSELFISAFPGIPPLIAPFILIAGIIIFMTTQMFIK